MPVKPSFIATIHKDTYPAISPTAAAPLPAGFAVFVTGASKGIGRAMPIAFAQAGASHIAFGARGDVSSVKTAVLAAAKAAGRPEPQVLALQLDVTDRASVAAAAQAVEVAFGKVDVVVNNAALMENWASILDVDPDEWWRVWEVNVRGVFEVTRALLPLLLRGTGKTVVNVGSQGGHLLSPGASAYQTSKFALMRLSEFLCCEYAEQGLVAWTAHPAGVATDMSHKLPPDSNFRESKRASSLTLERWRRSIADDRGQYSLIRRSCQRMAPFCSRASIGRGLRGGIST